MNSPSSRIVRRRSVFEGRATYVKNRCEAEVFLNMVKKSSKEASHNVCAYLIFENSIAYCSDDGEPNKTAGEPVLHVLMKKGVFNVCVVVTRYFGGVLLGTGGLVEAYTSACQAVFESAVFAKCCWCVKVRFEVDYGFYSKLQFVLKNFNAEILSINFAANVTIDFFVEFSKFENFKDYIRQKIGTGFFYKVLGKQWNRLEVSQSEVKKFKLEGKKSNK